MGNSRRPSLALNSLLTALQTHLQAQTQLLPDLHARLGLPPSALEDELAALEERLAACVAGPVAARAQEVTEWTARCAAAEAAARRHAAALGAMRAARSRGLRRSPRRSCSPRASRTGRRASSAYEEYVARVQARAARG
jgi:hypothetical protein